MLITRVHINRHVVSKHLFYKSVCKKIINTFLLCKVFSKFSVFTLKISLKHFVYNDYTKMFVIVKKIILHFYIA